MKLLKFRKKPVVIEAMRWLGDGHGDDVAAWILVNSELQIDGERKDDGWHLHIETLEGVMDASPGDWIIKGVQGEFYPCKPDIFDATYEPAPLGTSLPETAQNEKPRHFTDEGEGRGGLEHGSVSEPIVAVPPVTQWTREKIETELEMFRLALVDCIAHPAERYDEPYDIEAYRAGAKMAYSGALNALIGLRGALLLAQETP